jgi:hypothetical protein
MPLGEGAYSDREVVRTDGVPMTTEEEAQMRRIDERKAKARERVIFTRPGRRELLRSHDQIERLAMAIARGLDSVARPK